MNYKTETHKKDAFIKSFLKKDFSCLSKGIGLESILKKNIQINKISTYTPRVKTLVGKTRSLTIELTENKSTSTCGESFRSTRQKENQSTANSQTQTRLKSMNNTADMELTQQVNKERIKTNPPSKNKAKTHFFTDILDIIFSLTLNIIICFVTTWTFYEATSPAIMEDLIFKWLEKMYAVDFIISSSLLLIFYYYLFRMLNVKTPAQLLLSKKIIIFKT